MRLMLYINETTKNTILVLQTFTNVGRYILATRSRVSSILRHIRRRYCTYRTRATFNSLLVTQYRHVLQLVTGTKYSRHVVQFTNAHPYKAALQQNQNHHCQPSQRRSANQKTSTTRCKTLGSHWSMRRNGCHAICRNGTTSHRIRW